MQCRKFFHWALGILLFFIIAVPALAEGPAVAGTNGKIQGLYGNVDGDKLEGIGGSLTIPLCLHAGLQLDGAYGEIDEDQLKGIGFHLFSRDPQNYLLGIVGAHAELQDVDLNRIGFEGEWYQGSITLAAFLGQQMGDIDHNFFGTLDLRWYPTDDLMLVAGGSLADQGDNKLHVGAEYQILSGLATYVDFAVGENDYEHALGGLRFYFGGSKPLVQRHREDDLPNLIVNNILQGSNSLRQRQQELALAP